MIGGTDFWRRFKGWSEMAPVLGYALLTWFYTYPWSAHLLTQLPAGGDGLLSVWWTSHMRGAFLGLHGLNYSDYVFYPLNNVFLPSYTPISISVAIMGLPVSFLFDDVVAFNVCMYLSFVLTGWGTYLLVRYLTKNRWTSFVAGCVPAFAPYQYASFIQGHVDAISIQWFPFAVLFLLRLKDRPSHGNAVGLGVFLALIALTNAYFVFVLIVFLALFVLYFRSELFVKPMALPVASAVATAALLTLPFYLPLILYRLRTGGGGRAINEFDFNSSDLLSFFIPNSFHPLFAGLNQYLYYDSVMGTAHSYIGISVLLLAVWGLHKSRVSTVRFFGVVMIVFFILSLGSSLHIGRMRVDFSWNQGFFGVPPDTPIDSDGNPVLLPFYYLHKYVPFFSMQRYPSRFQALFLVSTAVLYGVGLAGLVSKMAMLRRQAVVAGTFFLLLGFEFLHPPVTHYQPVMPPFYEALGRERGEFAILNLPIAPHAEYLYYQTVHGKRIMIGYMSVPVPEFMRFVQGEPFLYAASNAHLSGKWFWGNPLGPPPVLDEVEIDRTIGRLRDWNVKYLVYHPHLDPIRDETIPRFFEAMARAGRTLYNDESVIAIVPDDLRSYPAFRRTGKFPAPIAASSAAKD